MPRKTPEQRFWEKIEKTDNCWLWSGWRDRDGYGKISISGTTRKAHRVSYELHFGSIPDGMHVLHKCDTPACVCPAHLFLGTHADNMRDRVSKGRSKGGFTPGSTHPMAKLNEAAIRAIRGLYADGATQTSLARQFGVHQTLISFIVTGKNWTHI